MRVRCSFCGSEYEAAVTRAALLLVDRCEHCGRPRLEAIEDGDAESEPRWPPRDRRDAPPGGDAA